MYTHLQGFLICFFSLGTLSTSGLLYFKSSFFFFFFLRKRKVVVKKEYRYYNYVSTLIQLVYVCVFIFSFFFETTALQKLQGRK